MHLSATLSQSNTWFVTFDHEKTLQEYQSLSKTFFWVASTSWLR